VKIRILSDRVANQIAAGEVIERPAAAVKELIENALDAGATRIDVEFRSAGEELIRVEDNGSGMSRDDALLALERHATSKIVEAADLASLASFGFRGEALPSIASVARFTLRTRAAEDPAGTEIAVNAGKVWHVRDCGRPVGTSVIVEHLFHPVPARRKFLKSEATEAAHIIQVVRLYALAFPAVAFSLQQDGRKVFQSPRGEALADRVAEIFGRDAAADLVPLEARDETWSVSGLICRPGGGRAGRQDMVIFVNRRPVESRTLYFALTESFKESLPAGRYPAAYLFLECDPGQVDVNVHPAKREIRFRQEPAVRGFIIRAVLQRLRDLAPPVPTAAQDNRAAGGQPVPPAAAPAALPAAPSPAAAGTDEVQVAEPAVREAGAAPQRSFAHWRWLGHAQAYAWFETPSGVVLLDRRAAAERIIYEQLTEEFRRGVMGSQKLLLPVPFELDPISSALLIDAREFLVAHGFEIADFGRHFFRLEAIPSWMEPADAEPLLRELLAALRDGRLDTRDADFAREQLALMASARAARSPAAPEQETRSLLSQLFGTRLPLTTPDGKPTFIEISWNELARRFAR
jgi:DNA mismatch repair protein MutL